MLAPPPSARTLFARNPPLLVKSCEMLGQNLCRAVVCQGVGSVLIPADILHKNPSLEWNYEPNGRVARCLTLPHPLRRIMPLAALASTCNVAVLGSPKSLTNSSAPMHSDKPFRRRV